MFDAKDSCEVGNKPAPAYFPRAGNTVDSLRSVNSHLKSSEKLVTEGLTTRPEPIEAATAAAIVDKIEAAQPPKPDFATLRKVAEIVLEHADKLDTPLAEQGEELDRAKVLEFATLPTPTAATVENAKQYAADVVAKGITAGVTREEFTQLKEGFNDSMSEVANMLLELQQYNALLEERIVKYNQRGGHRI